jgi:hypothetical protein
MVRRRRGARIDRATTNTSAGEAAAAASTPAVASGRLRVRELPSRLCARILDLLDAALLVVDAAGSPRWVNTAGARLLADYAAGAQLRAALADVPCALGSHSSVASFVRLPSSHGCGLRSMHTGPGAPRLRGSRLDREAFDGAPAPSSSQWRAWPAALRPRAPPPTGPVSPRASGRSPI